MVYTLPPLPYAYDALEPVIDAQTMELHHTKHHQTYIDKLNSALAAHSDFANQPIEQLLRTINTLPVTLRPAVQNHGGGHANHSLFWEIMAPNAGGEPIGDLAEILSTTFGSFGNFTEKFNEAATNQFGSGWAWLVKKPDHTLAVYNKPNQDSPLMDGDTPLLGLDIWEHAYYLKYQNRRADYIKAWWDVVNWQKVAELYTTAN